MLFNLPCTQRLTPLPRLLIIRPRCSAVPRSRRSHRQTFQRVSSKGSCRCRVPRACQEVARWSPAPYLAQRCSGRSRWCPSQRWARVCQEESRKTSNSLSCMLQTRPCGTPKSASGLRTRRSGATIQRKGKKTKLMPRTSTGLCRSCARTTGPRMLARSAWGALTARGGKTAKTATQVHVSGAITASAATTARIAAAAHMAASKGRARIATVQASANMESSRDLAGTAQRTCASTRGAATTAASAKEQGRVSTTTAAGVVASATAATPVNTASSKQIALSVKSARQAAAET
mmetsp:Transcript_67814/g.109989  ORF Transcript_67814/g.109989 Transcript_67814/m.109989 type:complete len:291 (+) Transcript_67814:116-988(+)